MRFKLLLYAWPEYTWVSSSMAKQKRILRRSINRVLTLPSYSFGRPLPSCFGTVLQVPQVCIGSELDYDFKVRIISNTIDKVGFGKVPVKYSDVDTQ